MARKLHFEVIPLSEVPSMNCDTGRQVVLVVDDEPLVADTLAKILSQAGFDARAAYNGTEALRVTQETPPGFLLTDVRMPGMDGVELAMRVAEAFPVCEILLFSGNATTADLEIARMAGHDFPLMEKPVHPEQLVRYIASSFSGDRNSVNRSELAEELLCETTHCLVN